MSAKLFSINSLKDVGREVYSESDMMARQLCLDTIDGIKELRLLAIEEIQARTVPNVPEPNERDWTDAEKIVAEGYTVIDALLHGRHREAVLPLVLEAFPEIYAKETTH